MNTIRCSCTDVNGYIAVLAPFTVRIHHVRVKLLSATSSKNVFTLRPKNDVAAGSELSAAELR